MGSNVNKQFIECLYVIYGSKTWEQTPNEEVFISNPSVHHESWIIIIIIILKLDSFKHSFFAIHTRKYKNMLLWKTSSRTL